jgi:hypothetical protein
LIDKHSDRSVSLWQWTALLNGGNVCGEKEIPESDGTDDHPEGKLWIFFS